MENVYTNWSDDGLCIMDEKSPALFLHCLHGFLSIYLVMKYETCLVPVRTSGFP